MNSPDTVASAVPVTPAVPDPASGRACDPPASPPAGADPFAPTASSSTRSRTASSPPVSWGPVSSVPSSSSASPSPACSSLARSSSRRRSPRSCSSGCSGSSRARCGPWAMPWRTTTSCGATASCSAPSRSPRTGACSSWTPPRGRSPAGWASPRSGSTRPRPVPMPRSTGCRWPRRRTLRRVLSQRGEERMAGL